jgi:hypothetical protein
MFCYESYIECEAFCSGGTDDCIQSCNVMYDVCLEDY